MHLWLCLAALTALAVPEPGLMGHWTFDQALTDASGNGHDAAAGQPTYVAGRQGGALAGQGVGATVPDSPDLRLAPGLCLETWVCFDQTPTTTETLVTKDDEYLLRVDSPSEGGRFAFFVKLSGKWEPRLSGGVPEVGRWYHLVAKWTGSESILAINHERYTAARHGTIQPTENPVELNQSTARMDDLRLLNPALARAKALQALLPGNTAPLTRSVFDGTGAWRGWRGILGADVADRGDRASATLPGQAAALVSPPLALPLHGERYVCVDFEVPGAMNAMLSFVTDQGVGTVPFPLWGGGRTTTIDVGLLPQWAGTLRLLALSVADEQGHEAALRGVWIGKQPGGRPYVYLRSFAPGSAILRAGREEKLLAVARNLGAAGRHVRIKLTVPAGVAVLGPADQTLPDLLPEATTLVEWRIRADRPVQGTATATVSCDGGRPFTKELPLKLQPPANLPRADYVPQPVPVAPRGVMTLMHYCSLWKEGTHYGWEKIEAWPERRPEIGWFDEGTPEVSDWHIKHAVEHGVQGFIYCWYRHDLEPTITQNLGHALDDGLLHARYLPQFKFALNWENANAAGVKDRADLLDNLFPFWLEKYFQHPSYAKLDGKPILYIYSTRRLTAQLGGSAQVREALDAMRAKCRAAGLAGLLVVAVVDGPSQAFLEQVAAEGYDATSAYGCWGKTTVPNGRDVEGITTVDYPSSVLGQEAIWREKKRLNALPDIIDVMMGWDPRPWHGPTTSSYIAPASPEAWEGALRNAKALLDATPGNGIDKRLLIFDNWNEFGEGHYLEPCAGFGFRYLDAIKRVFCGPDAPPCHDVVPADVGLANPERVYAERRELLGGFPLRPRVVKDHLVASWSFEDRDASLCRDSSNCGFVGFTQDFVSVPGKVGQGFACQGGSVTVAPHNLFTPSEGLTVALWCRTDVAGQNDRWLLNCVGKPDTGWRLGLGGNGNLAFQVPRTAWSHNLVGPAPLPLGGWHHVAATYDNEVMRLYLDGREVSHLDRGGPIAATGASLCLGNYSPNHSKAFFQGVMDEVKLWDRALTAEEIAARARE